jgi:hypothetical protein
MRVLVATRKGVDGRAAVLRESRAAITTAGWSTHSEPSKPIGEGVTQGRHWAGARCQAAWKELVPLAAHECGGDFLAHHYSDAVPVAGGRG